MIVEPRGPPPAQTLAIWDQSITPTPSGWNKERTVETLEPPNHDPSPSNVHKRRRRRSQHQNVLARSNPNWKTYHENRHGLLL